MPRNKPKMVCTYVDRAVSGAFGKTGSFVGRHPWYFVLLPLGLSVLLATGFLRINVVIGIEHLYAPVDGRTLDDKLLATELFPMNVSSNFDLGRMTRTAKFLIVLITAKNGGNVLTKPVMEECVLLDKAIRALSVPADGKNLTYEDVCSTKRGRCVKNDPGILAESIDEVLRGKKKIKYPIYIDERTYSFVFYGTILGGVELDFEDNVKSAEAFRFLYYLDDGDGERNRLSTLWDAKAVEYLETHSGENIDVKWFSRWSYSRELKKVTRSTAKLLVVVLVLVVVFNFFLFMNKRWTRSKPWLSVAAVFCVLLSIAAAWGLCVYCGVEFTSVVVFDFFLTMGLATKDTAVLISAWRRTEATETVDKRLGKAYSEVFVSVTMVFLISLICFLVGLAAPFRAAKIFCTYAAVTSLFFFLYEITFLGGCLALSGYRERKKLHPLICVTVTSKKSNRDGRCSLFCCTENGECGTPEEDFFISFRVWEKYVYFVQKPLSKIVVFLLYAAYLGVAIWQCTKLRVASGITDPFPSDSYITTYYERHYKYYTAYPHRVQVIIDTPLNYSDPVTQNKIEEVMQSFENSTYATGAVSSCWLKIFLSIVNNPKKNWLFRSYDFSLEEEFIFVLKNVFFKLPMTADIATDVVFNEEETQILASRCFFQTRNINDAESEKMMLEDFYRIADDSPIPVRFTSMLFRMYELATIIRQLVLWMLPISFCVVLIVFSLFIPNIPCILLGSLSVTSIQIGVLGFSNLWGVKINSFYSIIFVMLVGLLSSYLCHLSYGFSASDKNPKHRMIFALKSRGTAIIQNTLVLIISLAFLLLVTNQVSITFYKMFFLAVVFGYVHVLLVLPLLYSLIFGFRGNGNRSLSNLYQMNEIAAKDLLKT
ncbi:patched domain-containing protein 3-like isoform X2 [Centruroides sculpturatus]|uniref:patched domain-containing protein 3-like isoform X2 n=1 Tax=Centruroides sculpturatus TaxID=218467 RepID=UPI000C6D04D5|nr:patched domain-containing protein 3-like isoform X2 [Centruroides sculpturatus]